MYNQNSADHKGFGTPMSPRISFSNDFVDSSTASQLHQMMNKSERTYRDAPVSSDFEFNVTNYSMMSADQLFSKGRLLPFKESCSSHKTTTLRDELLQEDKDDNFSSRPPKSSTRWKGLLGLKKSHIGSKKIDKNNEGFSVEKRSNLGHEEMVHRSNNSQEPYSASGGGSSSKDVEFRFN